MKHARKKTSSAPKHKSAEREVQHRTVADYRRKYLGDDDSVRRVSDEISKAGYKPRRLDSYIPEEKSKPGKVRRSEPDDRTRRLNTDAVKAAAGEIKKKKADAPAKKTAAKKPAKSKKTKKKSRGILKKFIAAMSVVVVIAAIIATGILVGMYSAVSNELADMNVKNLALNYSSFVYYNDAGGNAQELCQLHFEGERRIWADSQEISQYFKDAAVSIEDERFYKHNGVDLKRSFGAAVGWALEKIGIGSANYGGSTLTQQLIKNITNDKDKTATRKIKEMMRAVALEKQLGGDKDAILTMYLNISFFANRCYGIEAASNLYFSKHASEVTPAEAATIVGITQRPTYYNPISNPDNALKKRNVVLMKMHELEYLSDEEYAEAKDSPLGISSTALESKKTVYSYFVDQVINDVTADLIAQKGYSETFAEQQVFSGGLKIYTTMDKNVQDAIESVFENRTGFPRNTKPQAAMMIVDQYTGEIKGMVGGAGKKTEARGLNRATHSRRQPGSSLKPLSVYAPGIETGKINSATVLRDEKITIGDWSPVNSYSGFKGDMILRRAIEISANIPAVKALQTLGLDTSYSYLTNKFNMKLSDTDKNLSALGLGGLTKGVTVREMAGAYAAIANGGMYIEPYTYTKVVDSAGKVLLEKKNEPSRALSASTAFIMTDLLSEVINGSSGTGRSARLDKMPAYGKTGTTNDTKDKWFVGFTKYYTGAVWFGFDQPASLKSAGISNNPSCVIWKNVMNKVHQGLEPASYDAPSSVKAVKICSKTGKLASSGCTYASTEYFVSGVPKSSCRLSHGGSHGSSRDAESSASPSPGADTKASSEPAQSTEPAATPQPAQNTPAPTQAPTQQPSDGAISLD